MLRLVHFCFMVTLFNLQGTRRLSQTALLDYHNSFRLSRTFFKFFQTFSSQSSLFHRFRPPPSRTALLDYHILKPLSRTFSNKSEFERKIKIIFHLDENCPEITCRMFCHSLSKIEARMEWSAGKSVRGLPRTGLEEIGFGVPRHARL